MATSITIKDIGYVRVITLSRESRGNALTSDMQCEYFDALDAADADDNIRAIVVTGAGKMFCVGADSGVLDALSNMGNNDASSVVKGMRRNVRQDQATKIGKPIVCAINGPAAGLGLILALFCDVKFAKPDAKLTTAFAKRGLIAEHGIAYLLPRLTGVANALDLILSARTITAKEGKEMGLINFLSDDPLKDAIKYATEMANNCSPAAIHEMKKQIYEALDQDRKTAYDIADEMMPKAFRHPDFKVGVSTLLNKNSKADFQGLKAGKISKL